MTTYFLNVGGALIAELDSSGNITRSYNWGPLGLISDTGSGGSRYYLYDGLGNTRMLLDATGQVIADCAYTAWGNCNSASYLPTPFGWKGQSGAYRDSETNLVLMGARYFSPALGRFISRDPIAFAGGVNVYGFCDGDPINYADPTGLCGESLGDVFAQLLSGDTWREGLATSGYALCNLLTGGRAFRDQTDRPGFRESQGSWAVGGLAAAGAACLVAAPVVASNPMYIAWMAGTLGGTGAAGAAASHELGELAEIGGETSPAMQLWRVVPDEEGYDIIEHNAFRAAPYGSEAKYFWGSWESAVDWQQRVGNAWFGGSSSIIQTGINQTRLLDGPTRMDGCPDAYTLPNEYLHLLWTPNFVK